MKNTRKAIPARVRVKKTTWQKRIRAFMEGVLKGEINENYWSNKSKRYTKKARPSKYNHLSSHQVILERGYQRIRRLKNDVTPFKHQKKNES